jgi:PAS domain S-box-containing protein
MSIKPPVVDVSRDALVRARERFLEDRSTPIGTVRPSVVASWERSIAYGVDPRRLVRQTIDERRLAERRAASRSLVAAATPFVELMTEALCDEPHLVALSDPEGTILLVRAGGDVPSDRLEATNLVEGASWHERDIGCNGIGTCLATGQPVLLIGAEHFQEAYIGWTCIGVPIEDAAGEIVGALDLSVPSESSQAHSWGWTLSVVKGIESALERGVPGGRAEAELGVDGPREPLQSVRGVLSGLITSADFPSGHGQFLEEALADLDTVQVADLAGANELVRREQELLERLINEIPVMVVIYDPEIREVRLNRHVERVLGWTNDDLGDHDIMELCYPDPEYRAEVRRFMASLEEGWRDFELTAKDGSVRSCSWANIRLTDHRQVGIGIDITERKHAEAEHQRGREAAEAALQERDGILAVVSHDLRNPLNTLLMSSSLLLDDISEEKKHAQIAIIRRSIDQMKRLIDDLLDAARIEGGGLKIAPTTCSCGELVDSAVQSLSPLAEAASVRLSSGAVPDVTVQADHARLFQVFSNLIGNAIEHTAEGGRVVVEGRAESDYVVFVVRDTGRGIAPQDLPRVFNRYWQARNTRRAGAGLGLAIARGIVEAHGGSIWVESEVEVGSAFSFSLPVQPSE